MNKISFFDKDGEILNFTAIDFPMLINGKEGSGASFFSVSLASYLYQQGFKLLFFTQKYMAKDQFLSQTGATDIFELTNIKGLSESVGKQCVIVTSGDKDLFKKSLESMSDLDSRIIFVKNIEETIDTEILQPLSSYPKIILSGDIENSSLRGEIKAKDYKTIISFSADRSAILENTDGKQDVIVKVQ